MAIGINREGINERNRIKRERIDSLNLKWGEGYPCLNILVIDDSPNHRESAQRIFKDHDLTVVEHYDEAWNLIEDKKQVWDVVLTDLVLPAGERMQNPDSDLVGMRIPAGWSLVLNSVLRGVKYVGCLSMGGHHASPAGAMLDMIDGKPFTMNKSTVIFSGHEEPVEWFKDDFSRENVVGSRGKGWGELLDKIFSAAEPTAG